MVEVPSFETTEKPKPGLRPDPKPLAESSKDPDVDFECLDKLVGQSIVSSRQFDKQTVVELCRFAAKLEATEVASYHPLDGLISITAFFEASTRTRLSFESAVIRLDGKILSIPDGHVTGQAKGESVTDIGEMFNAYGDIVIMRHTDTDSVKEILKHLRIPLVNAGNGTGEHPTQALADWYALLKWRPGLASCEVRDSDKIHLGIIGTPGSMRAVRSFLMLSLLFENAIKHITIVSELADPLGTELERLLKKSKVGFSFENDLKVVEDKLDVLYMNSITFLGDAYRSLDSRYQVSPDTNLKPEAVVMHPLARKSELSEQIDQTEHNLYFSQAAGAVYVRQALLICLLNRFDRLPKSINPLSDGKSRK